MSDLGSEPGGASFLRVVRGQPTPEELAAVVAVVAARLRGAAALEPEAVPRSQWLDRAALLGAAPRPGAGAWRASALPR